jgi:asparagine synthase (glutamine-hydrolysing)
MFLSDSLVYLIGAPVCGIYGLFSSRGAADPLLIERMARVLAHRGPDGYGVYHHGPLAFGAGRLAIIDLSAPAGPIFNEDHSVAVVYNGEIYNHRLLRSELEALGHRFATGTDTEVIVHGYEQWGDGVLERLRGMFALCLWDEPHERLLLARDRLGEKPLYYAQVGDEFLFASEIKGLLEHPGLARVVDADALLTFLVLGYIAPPRTMFEGIHKLAPGERLIVDRSGQRHERYWQPVMDTWQAPGGANYDKMVRQVRDLLVQSVEMRMMSDVPLGVFLSGGVDSTAIAAIVSRALDRPVQSFTVSFDMPPGSGSDRKFNVDARYAELASRSLKTEHHAITIGWDESLRALFPHLVYAMDEPLAQPAIVQTAYVSALARLSGVPVLLSGDGSDELFAGSPSCGADRVLERYLRIPGLLRQRILTPLLERMPARFDRVRKLAHKSRDTEPARRYLHWERRLELESLPGLMSDPTLADQSFLMVRRILHPVLDAPRSPHFADRIAFTTLNLWLAEDSNMRVDKMGMAMSIEARAPFEDHHLVDLALHTPLQYKLRNGDFKVVLKDAVRDFVPPEILARPKWGFFPPCSEWLRTVLRPLVDEHLSPDRVEAAGFFQPAAVSQVIDNHMSKRSYELWPLWTLLVFHLWYALYIDRSLTLDHTLTPEELRHAIVE